MSTMFLLQKKCYFFFLNLESNIGMDRAGHISYHTKMESILAVLQVI